MVVLLFSCLVVWLVVWLFVVLLFDCCLVSWLVCLYCFLFV